MATSQKLLHRSKDYSNLLKNVIDNEINPITSNNEKLWVAMGTELEIQGIEKILISTIMRKDIEDMLYEKQFKEFMSRDDYKWHNGKYWIVTKNNGWTNPDMARNVSSDPDKDQDNSSINTRNYDMIILCDDVIDICRTIKDKAKDNDTPLFEDVFSKKKMREFYRQRMSMIANCKDAIDNKTKVPVNTEIFLLECLATVLGNTNKCVEVFMEQNLIRLKEQGKFFTLKQATKFQKGSRQSQLIILKPNSRDSALYGRFSGVQCTCGSWSVRQRQDDNKLECYICDNVMPPGHISKCENCQIPLYKERLQYMTKHQNKCPECKVKNDIPQELIQYAKS